MKAFRAGKLWLLVCTDLMARGVDFKGHFFTESSELTLSMPRSGLLLLGILLGVHLHEVGSCRPRVSAQRERLAGVETVPWREGLGLSLDLFQAS